MLSVSLVTEDEQREEKHFFPLKRLKLERTYLTMTSKMYLTKCTFLGKWFRIPDISIRLIMQVNTVIF